MQEALFQRKKSGQSIQCTLCPHECVLAPGKSGVCGVRKNADGILYSLVYGYPVVLNPDPVEKKPLYHFLPGTRTFSLATAGCNLKCSFCQNWQISQSGPDPDTSYVDPDMIIEYAVNSGCHSIAFTYTEPTVFFEYAADIAERSSCRGLKNIFVTNGYINQEAIERIAPVLHGANVDLKSFSRHFYQKLCGGSLNPVLEAIRILKQNRIWVEVTTLLIPGMNDDPQELKKLTGFLAEIDPSIPWHISRYRPEFKFTGVPPTPVQTLLEAREIGLESGLQFIYLGNAGEKSHSYCPSCSNLLIERGFMNMENNFLKNGVCPKCGVSIPGVWK